MRVKFHPEARRDVREGRDFYRRRSPIAAIAFAHEVDTAIARIKEAPLRFAENEYGTRSFTFPWRFPYTIVYKVMDTTIVIVAVAHHSKEPGYWRARVNEAL
jgi:plasmid stabilization system protein ParE